MINLNIWYTKILKQARILFNNQCANEIILLVIIMAIAIHIKTISIEIILLVKIDIYIKVCLVHKIIKTSLIIISHLKSMENIMKNKYQEMRRMNSFAVNERGVKVPSFAII